MHVFKLLQTKLYVLLVFRAVYCIGVLTKHEATLSYAYFRW